MLKYILKRLLSTIPVLIVVTLLVFMMVHLIPGDPARVIAGDMATDHDVELIRISYGFDRPLSVQYLSYMSKLLRGDLGISFRTSRPVWDDLKLRFPMTLLLALWATVVASILGIMVGLVAAVMRYSFIDNFLSVVSLLGLSTPPFYLGLMLILLFCVQLKWLPISSNELHIALILPVISVSARSLAVIARMTRSSMLEVMGQDYILAAKSQGYKPRKIIIGWALKNAMMAVITQIGLQFGILIGGAVVVEKVFGWPGIGDYLVSGIKGRDFQVVQSTVLLISLAFVAINLLVDIMYALINPKVKLY